MLKWKIRVRRRREARKKGEKDVRGENRLAQKRGRERGERGEGGRERGINEDASHVCSLNQGTPA